jgi:hypothetical protein
MFKWQLQDVQANCHSANGGRKQNTNRSHGRPPRVWHCVKLLPWHTYSVKSGLEYKSSLPNCQLSNDQNTGRTPEVHRHFRKSYKLQILAGRLAGCEVGDALTSTASGVPWPSRSTPPPKFPRRHRIEAKLRRDPFSRVDPPARSELHRRGDRTRLWRPGMRAFRRSQDDHRVARLPHASRRHRQDRQRV